MKLPSRNSGLALAFTFVALVSGGCASVKRSSPGGEEAQSFLYASAAEQAATGPRDCRLYVDGLSGRLARSHYGYEVRPIYYCSIGAECHVLLRVNTGVAQFVADNGSFIQGHVVALPEFERRMTTQSSWREMKYDDARLLMLAERYGRAS